MFALDITDPCAAGEQICGAALDLTGNATIAAIADVAIGKPLALIGLALLALFARWALHRVIDRVVSRAEEGVLPDRVTRMSLGRSHGDTGSARDMVVSTRRVQRAQTMGSLLKSIVSGVVIAVAATMMLSELGVDVAPIVASAGIIGVALGFGSQTLVKDFLSGIFMIFEDQYGVGDVVDLGEASGTVEAVSLRVTRLRDVNGTVWYVRNGEILRVGNMSQNWARSVLDVNVGYREDLVRVRQVLRDIAHDLWEDDDFRGQIIEEPEVWGVESITPEGVVVRVTLKTAPMEQWAIAREMRERILARFAYEGIEIPIPQRMVWHRDEPTAPSSKAEDADRTVASDA
jgi:small-conductance mechanosensitive channel